MTAVTIERIAAGGEGVGRLEDGMTVFAPRTAPGDVAVLEVAERRRRFARGRVVQVATPGPDRVEPACRHYVSDRCGGCQLQHLSARAQLAAKRAIVGDALRRIGGQDVADPEIVPSLVDWRYRTRIALTAKGSAMGLHPYDRPDAVFDLVECPITRDPIMALWAQVRRHRALLPSPLQAVVLREDRDGGLHVVASGSGSARPWDAAPLLMAVGDPRICYWWAPERGAARVVAGPAPAFPAQAFEQVNPELAVRIRAEAVRALGEVTGRVVWDLYGGVGDTGGLVAREGAQAWSVDVDRSAVAWGQRRWEAGARAGVPGSLRFVLGRVEESLRRLPEPDAIVVNPPRTGLAPRVTAKIEQWARRRTGGRVAYISCDPATLARDLARMPALALSGVVAYDLFPQTAHVEALAVLEAR